MKDIKTTFRIGDIEYVHTMGGKEALLSLVAFASEAIENRDFNTALTVLRDAKELIKDI